MTDFAEGSKVSATTDRAAEQASTSVDKWQAVSVLRRLNTFRWGYLVPRLLLVSVFWSIMCFAFEPALKYLITAGSTAVLQTTVDLDRLSTQKMVRRWQVDRIQIADRSRPGQNALEIEQVAVNLDRDALLRKKLVINHAVISGIAWNTQSTLQPPGKDSDSTGWTIPFGEQAGKISQIATQAGASAIKTLLQATLEQYDPRHLETVRLADIKEDQWQVRFDHYRNKTEQLEQRIDLLKVQVEQGSRGNPLDQLDRYAQILREMEALTAEGKKLKSELTQLTSIARQDMAELDAARQRDLQNIQQTLQSIPLNGQDLTVAILGPETARQCGQLAQWLGFIQRCMNVATEDYQPVRNYGRTIDFDRSSQLPIFLVRQLDISGHAQLGEEQVPFAGQLQHLTHAPRQYGQPSRFQFKVRHHGDYQLEGVCDLTGDVPHYSLHCDLSTSEFPLQQLLNEDRMQLALLTGQLKGQIQVELVGDQIDARLSWRQSEVEFQVAGETTIAQPELTKLGLQPFSPASLLQNSVRGIDQLQGEVLLSGSVARPTITLQSNIGDTIVAGIQREFQREAASRQQEVQQLASQQIDARLKQLTSKIDQEYRSVLTKLNLNESLAQGLIEKTAIRPTSGVLDRLLR